MAFVVGDWYAYHSLIEDHPPASMAVLIISVRFTPPDIKVVVKGDWYEH